jgi:hypothetical protein
MKNTLVIIILVFASNFLYAQIGQVEKRAMQSQREKEDFENKVQRPFSAAYGLFKNQVKELSGSENNEMKFFDKIPDSLNTIDSLRVALYVQTYKNASITYQIATIEWICSHTDSFKSPGLIQSWWPKEGWRLVYNALSEQVKGSKFGQNLKNLIENPPKAN